MIWLILIVALILRLISLNQSLWLDEAINVLATQKFSLLGMITEYAKADFHPPGFFIILWIWTKIFGTGEIFVRLPSVIFGVLTIYLIYKLGQKISSKKLGLYCAFLLAVNPLHIYYSQEARMYSLSTLAVAINFFLLTKLIMREKVNLLFLILSNLLVLSSDYVAYLIFPSQLIILLLNKQKDLIKIWVKGLFISFLAGVWWVPIFLSQLKMGSDATNNLPIWKVIVGGFDVKTSILTLVKFIIGRISLFDKQVYYAILLPVCSLFVFLIFRGATFIKGAFRNLLLSWLIIPIILATAISFVVPIYSYFRVLFTLPAFIILLSLGIISYKSKLRYIFLGLVLLIQIFSSLTYLFNVSYQREDWRGMVRYLESKGNALVLFESSGTLSPFDYYAKNAINTKGALKVFPAKNYSDLIDLESLQSDLYLVDYIVEFSDPKRLVKGKLNELGYQLVDTKDFHGVGFLYHYVK